MTREAEEERLGDRRRNHPTMGAYTLGCASVYEFNLGELSPERVGLPVCWGSEEMTSTNYHESESDRKCKQQGRAYYNPMGNRTPTP
jgi:hypothetical protein